MEKQIKTAIVSVISDLVTDQRVHRTSLALHRKGLKVTLVGRQLKNSMPLLPREYETRRFKLWFETGPLFYAAYNIRLFFYLLFHKADILVANDLDTLTANYIISGIKKSALYYDSHEYFTEVPELVNRPRTRSIWKWIERRLFPKLKHVFTVNDSIAHLYEHEYGIKVGVVRNVPISAANMDQPKTRKELGLPENRKILLFQGAGINIQRGAEETLQAMQFTDGMILLFIGGGDIIDTLKKKSSDLKLDEKVIFIPKLPMQELVQYTRLADAGLSLDKDTNINYRYSLPNKLFDYIHAGIPVLVSDLPEVSRIVKDYNIGLVSTSHDPIQLAKCMHDLFSDQVRFKVWKENLKLAAAELCWEKEEKKFLEIFKDVI